VTSSPLFCRLHYRLTLRDLSEILLLRGIEVSHETVRDWRPSCCRSWARRCASAGTELIDVSWYVDEAYLKVRGQWRYIYRAFDRNGNLIDAMLSEHRDMKAAQAFFRLAKATIGLSPG
jgi:putative transposase